MTDELTALQQIVVEQDIAEDVLAAVDAESTKPGDQLQLQLILTDETLGAVIEEIEAVVDAE